MSKLSDAADALDHLCEENEIERNGGSGEEFILDTIAQIRNGDYDFNERAGAFRLGVASGVLIELTVCTLEEIERDVENVVIS